jgi:hypothetical protein
MGEGDENSARDMGRFINRCGLIEQRYECLVIVVHHMGKNTNAGGRGSNAQNGAADATLTVEKQDTFSTVTITEMKDGPEGQQWTFRLLPVDVAEGGCATSSATSTCVVELISEPSPAQHGATRTQRPASPIAADLLKIIERAVIEAGEAVANNQEVPRGARAINRPTLRSYCKTMAWQQDREAKSFRTTLSRQLSALRTGGFIGFDEEWLWLAR